MSRTPLQAVFFDFDGVIADSEPLHLRAYQAVLARDGIELAKEDYYARYLGYDDVGLFQALAKDRGVTVTSETIDAWVDSKAHIIEQMLSSAAILFPGAAECVRLFAARVPIAVASGALEPEIDMVLRHAGLRECFAAIASASDGVRGKPAPDLYLLAMAKLKGAVASLNPASCIAIEDSHWGLEAARSSGLRCVAVTNTYAAGELGLADLIVEHLGDLSLSTAERLIAGPAHR
jgi:beta-phosphoglucomutase-like phosphatase (HAD superfamily)